MSLIGYHLGVLLFVCRTNIQVVVSPEMVDWGLGKSLRGMEWKVRHVLLKSWVDLACLVLDGSRCLV